MSSEWRPKRFGEFVKEIKFGTSATHFVQKYRSFISSTISAWQIEGKMPARLVKFEAGGYYHVYNRGANRNDIFLSKANYHFLIGLMSRRIMNEISVIAFCLMPNHYHFLLRQNGKYLVSQFIQSVFNVYTKAFNRWHGRTGTLFEGPFKAIKIFHENHLIHLCRYIHRNPLDAGLINHI